MSTATPACADRAPRVGTTRRHALYCEKIRSVRVDAKTEAFLSGLIQIFAGLEPADSVNPSMIFRRALGVYYRYVSAELTDLHALAAERLKLIENTRKPRTRAKGQTTHVNTSTNTER